MESSIRKIGGLGPVRDFTQRVQNEGPLFLLGLKSRRRTKIGLLRSTTRASVFFRLAVSAITRGAILAAGFVCAEPATRDPSTTAAATNTDRNASCHNGLLQIF